MNTAILFQAFSSAITWNGILHVVTQSFFFIRTVTLYKTLTSQDFSLWANSTSIIYLLLLWLDCGFRRSIPWYAPQFARNSVHWLYRIALFQITLQLAGLPLLYVAISRLTDNAFLIIVISGIYIAEGLHSLIRTVYDAYLHTKQFNQIALSAACIEIFCILILTTVVGDSSVILIGLLTIKLITTIGMSIRAVQQFQYQLSPQELEGGDCNLRLFALQSGALWASTVLKSMSERNIIIPLITYYMGPEMGNISKLATDGAVHLYRMVIKTIGTADTALLAHIENGYAEAREKRKAIEIALEKLTTQMARLSLPLLGIVGVSMVISYMMSYDPFVFHAFFIMAVGYLIETTYLPYERLLEVKRSYRVLFLSYVPYVCLLCILFLFLYISCIGLLPFLLFLQGVRLVTGLLLRTQVYRYFHI